MMPRIIIRENDIPVPPGMNGLAILARIMVKQELAKARGKNRLDVGMLVLPFPSLVVRVRRGVEKP